MNKRTWTLPLAILAWAIFIAAFCLAFWIIGRAGSTRAQAAALDKCIALPDYSAAEWMIIWPIELAIAARSSVEC